MSVSSMANVAVARRDDELGQKDEDGQPAVPNTQAQMAAATGGTPETETMVSGTLKAVATYIPTEVIGLYLAALAAVRSGIRPEGVSVSTAERTGSLNLPSSGELTVFVVFAVLTPVIVWLVYAGKVRAAGKSTPKKPNTWPTWEMFAALVGFTAWAFSLPDSPFARFSWYNLSWATFVVLAVSSGLGLIGPVMQRTLKT
jgi:hypothetical protein